MSNHTNTENDDYNTTTTNNMTKEDKNSKKGLASADEETRERIAKAGGEARAEDKESLRSW
jgi:hypothetical protein